MQKFIKNFPELVGCYISCLILTACGSNITFSDYTKGFSGQKKQTAHISAETVNPSDNKKESLSLNPGCLQSGNKTLRLSGFPEYLLNTLEIPERCFLSLDPETTRYTRPVLNLAFVVDISGSMEESLSGVQNSITYLAKILDMKGWKASYLGIAFKDEIWKTIDSESPSEFVAELKLLEAEGGGADHPQEAGFLGIQKALDLLSEKQSPGNRNVMFYVSNAPAWYKDDLDFQPDSLVDYIKNSEKISGLDIDFFYSIPKDNQIAEKINLPMLQMEGLLAGLSWSSDPLVYPLTQNAILEPFIEKIPEPESPAALTCKLKSVDFLSGDELIPLFDRDKISLANESSWKWQVDLNISGGYALTIKRCCLEEEDQSGTCHTESTASLLFETDEKPKTEI